MLCPPLRILIALLLPLTAGPARAQSTETATPSPRVYTIGSGSSITIVSGQPAPAPKVYLLDPAWILRSKAMLDAGNAELKAELGRLLPRADAALNQRPFSVTFNPGLPSSGDKHDYMSQGPYWWPDPAKPDGLPYIQRDGQTNPESRGENSDLVLLERMMGAVDRLAKAYWFTAEEKYADHAALLLRTWFLNPETRMNPNLNFGQAIPGITEGRGIGIVETHRLLYVVDAVGLLAGSKAWTADDQKGIESWFRDYAEWLQTSRNGRDEDATTNNHASWYDLQVVVFSLMTGQEANARRVLEAVKTRRIATHIQPDGSMPRELGRTRAWPYSLYNLRPLSHLAQIGGGMGIDLWNFRTEDGRSLGKAIEFLYQYHDPNLTWPHDNGRANVRGLIPYIRLAWSGTRDPRYIDMMKQLTGDPEIAKSRGLLQPPLE